MAVAADVTMTTGNSADGFNQQAAGVTSISSTGINVGAAATGLVMVIGFGVSGAATSITATWNSVSMTAQGAITSSNTTAAIFVIPSPASGNKTLAASWTTANDAYMSAVSFTGSDTTTVVKVADNASATQTTTLTITSDANGATVATFTCNSAAPTVNFTKIYSEAPLNPGGGASYTLGGTSNAHTFTGAGGTEQALVGVHVIAAAAVAGNIAWVKG